MKDTKSLLLLLFTIMSPLTTAQQVHIDTICRTVTHNIQDKYTKGQQEHGGNLWEKECIGELGQEITDLVIYYHQVKERHTATKQLVEFFRTIVDSNKHLSNVKFHIQMQSLVDSFERLYPATT